MDIKEINRISIIGGPGTGKTTLSDKLGKKYNMPVYHLDGIHHLENWIPRDKDERDRMILEKAQEDKWIMDGTYKTTLEERVERSDVIIYLNYSRFARIKGIMGRYLKNRNKEKPEIPGCKEKMDTNFLKFTFNWDKTKGDSVKEILEKNNDKKIYVFKNRKQLNKWYEKLK